MCQNSLSLCVVELWLSAEQKGDLAQPGYRHKKVRVMYKETSRPVYRLASLQHIWSVNTQNQCCFFKMKINNQKLETKK